MDSGTCFLFVRKDLMIQQIGCFAGFGIFGDAGDRKGDAMMMSAMMM